MSHSVLGVALFVEVRVQLVLADVLLGDAIQPGYNFFTVLLFYRAFWDEARKGFDVQ